MFFIRQNATHKVVLGPAVAVGDGFTPVTNLDVATADEAEAIKHNDGTVVDISGYTWAAIATADGYYHLTLQSAISGTVGHLTIVVNDDSLILPLRAGFTVLEESVYDAMYAAAATGPALATDVTTAHSTTDGKIDRNADLGESRRGFHTWQGNYFYVDPVNGDTHANGNRGGRSDPYLTIQDCHDNAVTDSNHDVIFLVAGHASTATTHTIAGTTTISKRYVFIRGPGRDFIITRTGAGNTIDITGDGIELSGVQIGTAGTGAGDGINVTDADFHRIHHCWFLDTRGDGVHILRGSNTQIHDNHFEGTGVGGSGQGVHIVGTGGSSNDNVIHNNHFANTAGDSILIEQGTTNDTEIHHNTVHDSAAWGINIGGSSTDAQVHSNILGNNASGDIQDGGTTTILQNNEQWLRPVHRTTIATLASQTSFTLSDGSSDDDAYAGLSIVVQDKASTVQKAHSLISAYSGGAKTITLPVDPGVFAMAAGDTITISATATAPGVADEVLTGATHNVTNSLGRRVRELDELVGYEGGAVWLDTVNGTAGDTPGDDGTVDNPTDNITDAITIAEAKGLVRIRVASGSSVTLLDALDGYEIFNTNWTLVLNDQSISGTCVSGASITGISTGANRPQFEKCQFGAVTLPPSILKECGIGASNGTFTFGGAGEYIFDECYSVVPGSGTPSFVATGLGSSTGINNRAWKGGANYTLDSDITLSHEVLAGGGTTVTTGGADVEIRGITRSVTLILSNAGTVQFVGITGPIIISGTATTTVNLYGISSTFADTSSGTTVADNTLNQANVNTEVNVALDTAISELGVAQPTATPTLRTGLMLLYMALRQKLVVQTSGTDAIEFYDDAGTLIWKKTISDDESDYTEDKGVSG